MVASSREPRGLVFFAERASSSLVRARARLAPADVKRARTSLRRVRAMCEVLSRVAPDPRLDVVRREAKATMRALGVLRDLHVERALLATLAGDARDPLLARALGREHRRAAAAAHRAAVAFDAGAFVAHVRAVARAHARLVDDRAAMTHVAWERLREAAALVDDAAERAHEVTPLHALRIALKRFRYVVESFLPELDGAIGPLLKAHQDLLGEIHDLDVVRARIVRGDAPMAPALRRRSLQSLAARRAARVRRFIALVDGGLLAPCFAALPTGEALSSCAVARLAAAIDAACRAPLAARRRARHATVLHEALVDAHVLPLSSRGAALAALAARATARAARHDETKTRAALATTLTAHRTLAPLDDELVPTLAHLIDLAHADAPRTKPGKKVRERPTHALAALVRLVSSLDTERGAPRIDAADVEGATLVITLSGGRVARIPRAELRAFERATGLSLVVARLFRA